MNAVSKDEHRELLAEGDATLAKTKCVWLQKPNKMKRGRCMLLKAGIINAIVLKATTALGESMNAKIRKIKAQVCGERNRQRFRDAIMFHLGGLDMYHQKLAYPDKTVKRQFS